MRLSSLLALAAIATLPLITPGTGVGPTEAVAAGANGVRMEIIVDGRVAREYDGRRKTYIQAYKGKEYAIRLSNDTPGRVAVALSVDGLNTIDAKHTTAREATKWVLGPWEQVTITGWQVGPDHARQFVFTSEESSYGAWLGETRNLGNISAVFYGEQTPCCDDPAPYTSGDTWDWDGALGDSGGTPRRQSPRSSEPRGRDRGEESAPLAEAEAPAERSGGSASSRSSAGADADDSGYWSEDRSRREKKSERAATGTGRRTRHSVEWVAFDLDPNPIATTSLRYGFRDELVELGILPRPRRDTSLSRRESGSGFAPDPGGSCCR